MNVSTNTDNDDTAATYYYSGNNTSSDNVDVYPLLSRTLFHTPPTATNQTDSDEIADTTATTDASDGKLTTTVHPDSDAANHNGTDDTSNAINGNNMNDKECHDSTKQPDGNRINDAQYDSDDCDDTSDKDSSSDTNNNDTDSDSAINTAYTTRPRTTSTACTATVEPNHGDPSSDDDDSDSDSNSTVDDIPNQTNDATTKCNRKKTPSTNNNGNDSDDAMDIDDIDSTESDSTDSDRTNRRNNCPAPADTSYRDPESDHSSGSGDIMEETAYLVTHRQSGTNGNRSAPLPPIDSQSDEQGVLPSLLHRSDRAICLRLSSDIASFYINYRRAPQRSVRCLPDFCHTYLEEHFKDFMEAILLEPSYVHYHYTEADRTPISDSLNYVLDRATKQIFEQLSESELEHFRANSTAHYLEEQAIPTSFRQLHKESDERSNQVGQSMTCALIYALMVLYLAHHRDHSKRHSTDHVIKHYYPRELATATREIFTTSIALSFLPETNCFRIIPWFLDIVFKSIDVLPILSDIDPFFSPDDATYILTPVVNELSHVMPYIDHLVTSFHTSPHLIHICQTKATRLARQTLHHHGILFNMIQDNKGFPFEQRYTIMGNLPPADLIFSAFASAFPMFTELTHEQLHSPPSRHPTAIAVNFVICKPFTQQNICSYHYDRSNIDDTSSYSVDKPLFKPLPTSGINDSIDFLPYHEYKLFRVVNFIQESDPYNRLGQHRGPKRVIVFQGNPLYSSSYTYSSPLTLSLPQVNAHTFPITYDNRGNEIIWSESTNEPYNSTTVQNLFNPQPCVPMTKLLQQKPEHIPNSADDRRFTLKSAIHHVANDPTKIPFGLSLRLIQVYTIRLPNRSVHHAWALPHPNDALSNPSQSPYQNPFSYFNKRTEHPENRYLESPDTNSPVNPDSTGEFVPADKECSVGIISGVDLSFPSQNSVTNVTENGTDSVTPEIKYHRQTSSSFSGQHQAFLAVQTRRSSLRPSTPAHDDPPTEVERPPTGEVSSPSSIEHDDDITLILPQNPTTVQASSTQTTESSLVPPQHDMDDSTQTELEPITQPSALQRISLAVSQILTPKSSPTEPVDLPAPEPAPTLQPAQPLPSSSNLHNEAEEDKEPQPIVTPAPQATNINTTGTPRPLPARRRTTMHPTFSYPPRVDTFFDNDDSNNSDEEPAEIHQSLPTNDDMTSSTRTDFTYPPIEDLTKTLLKYASTANLRRLAYPTDLSARRRHFNTFMDNLRIVCNISPWTRQVFDLWPEKISYSHPVVGTSLFNLLFTNITDPCQKHIIDGPPDFRTAIFTLRRHCAPLTSDHIERTRQAFFSLKQQHQEVATSYLNRIRLLTRDCYHAGIPNSDIELIKRTVRGGSNHHFYAASYHRFDADICRAELNDEPLPNFAELESHLLSIDDTRGLTIPSQNQRIYNQHANSTRHFPPAAHSLPRNAHHRNFTRRQQQAFSTILSPYNGNSNGNSPRANQPARRNPTNPQTRRFPPNSNSNNRRHQPNQHRPSTNFNRNNTTRPPNRPNNSATPQQRRTPTNGYSASTTSRPQTNMSNVVCNNCGRTGHYARQCPNAARSTGPPNRGQRSPPNNENAPPRNQQRAYYVTDSSNSSNNPNYHHQAFLASMTQPDDHPSTVVWPDNHLPQMEINQPLLDRDFPPSTRHQPPNTSATELYPYDPNSPHQRFGPPTLQNWLPDSGATSHYTPVFSDLRDVVPCNVPISLADGSTKQSTHKGTTECYFTSDDGQKSILGLTDVYYVEGLSHRLLSLTAISGTQNFCVIIQNKATTIRFPDDSTFTWPLLREELPTHQAFATSYRITTWE